MKSKNKVVVALSGGVDSAATAYILKKKGYNVIGVTLKLVEDFNCLDAEYIANVLKIEHYVIDLRDYFQQNIINQFIQDYIKGETPNPCIECNKHIKYGKLLSITKEFGCDYLALGHYARIEYNEVDGKYHLYKGLALRKDQSYNLYHLNQEVLSSIILPLGDYVHKDEVRKLVRNIISNVSRKKDSNNICFISDINHGKYIREKVNYKSIKGNFVDKNGTFLGKHKGIFNYTIGQRKGLGQNFNKPMFVVNINSSTNEIVLGEEKDLFYNEIILNDVNYILNDYRNKDFKAQVKICQWGYFLNAEICNKKDNTVRVIFEKPVRAPAVGQAAVFYIGDEVIGGGTIKFKI